MSEHMDEILASFIQEATEAFSDLENDLLEVERAGADVDADLVNQIFRNVHSVKGTAGFCGLRAIGDLAHEMENVLNLVRNRELVPEPTVVEAVLKAADSLVAMVNDLATSGDVDAANAVDIAHHVSALKAVAAGEAAEVAADATHEMEVEVDISLPDGSIVFLMKPSYELTSRQKRGLGVHVIEVDFIHDIEATGRSATEFLAHLYEHGEVIDSFLSTAGVGQLDDGAPETMTFFVLYAAAPNGSDLATTLGLEARCVHDIATAEQTDWSVWPPVADATASSAASAATPPAAPGPSSPSAAEPSATPSSGPARTASNETEAHGATRQVTSLRVGVQVLDELMNLAGELVLARNQLLQEASKSGSTVDAVATKIDRITSELQEAIMQTRMQQVGTVFNKFPRIVRDLSANLGKECSLTVEGKDVELDKSIIEAIGDPLTHLIRNSVDHGVELPSVRAERGKPAAGSVLLKAFHQAGKVNITIADDGAGIDAERLKARAVEKGVLTQAEADELTDRQAHLLIFHPGFSTAEQVTDVSGRGVGMDVVRTNIEKLGGTIDIETAIGVGTTMNIQLPLTLAIIPSLVVRNGGKPYAISQANICELIRVKASEIRERIQKVRGAEVLRLRGDLLPLVRLSTAVGEPSRYENFAAQLTAENRREAIADRRTPDLAVVAEAVTGEVDGDASETERREANDSDRRHDTVAGALNILVLESGEQRYGLVVEALEDSQEIVVKPLGRHMEHCGILAGATILGDGQTALILDVAGIASHCRLRAVEAEAEVDAHAAAVAETVGEVQSVLLFENHPGEYFAVPNTLVSRIERIKASQIDSVGGLEVLQYRGESLLVLSLESHIQANPRDEHESLHIVVFRIAGKDLGLIAPRLSDIRDLSSAIDTVTFREPGILGSQVVDDHTVRFVDIVELAKSSHPDWFRDEAGAQGGERPRILLAEDSGFFRNQLTSFLTSAGYEVDAGEDGEEAWSLLQNPDARYDMLLTDIEMPNLDGLELTRRVRSDPMFAHLPIVALTSLASDEDVQRGMEAGVTRYEVKMDRERLVKIIGEVVSQARQRAGLGAIAHPQTETAA